MQDSPSISWQNPLNLQLWVDVRGLFSAKVPYSSYAEVRMGLLIEPTHLEDENEDEDQENEKEYERDGEECREEGPRVSRQQQHADDTWDDVRETP